jgi:hypothetical protein
MKLVPKENRNSWDNTYISSSDSSSGSDSSGSESSDSESS